mmetsp:Transcript_1705/g.2203  ORF Transcript_1705/g.2203 Transcript_1705/m.2203 type:complete len:158 (-) Transcript_1705:26-499(-)
MIEKELTEVCKDILDLLNDHLVPKAKTEEGLVFLHKMKGDYYRYIAEFASGEQKNQAADQALQAYEQAHTMANECLDSTHPIRLGLALNYSVFYYEIKQNATKACKMAREAFEQAISDLDNVDDDFYKDATLIMQLLRDNLTLWTEETEVADGGEQQ